MVWRIGSCSENESLVMLHWLQLGWDWWLWGCPWNTQGRVKKMLKQPADQEEKEEVCRESFSTTGQWVGTGPWDQLSQSTGQTRAGPWGQWCVSHAMETAEERTKTSIYKWICRHTLFDEMETRQLSMVLFQGKPQISNKHGVRMVIVIGKLCPFAGRDH